MENDWSVLFFFPKEHVRTLILKEIKNIIDFLLLKVISPLVLSVQFCIVNNFAEFQLLPMMEFSFNI